MKINWKGIFEGTWNSIFIKEEIERVAKERLEICKSCPMNSDLQKQFSKYKTFRPDFHCTVCKCDLHLKTRALSQECPLEKWKAYVNEEEEYEIQKRLENE